MGIKMSKIITGISANAAEFDRQLKARMEKNRIQNAKREICIALDTVYEVTADPDLVCQAVERFTEECRQMLND